MRRYLEAFEIKPESVLRLADLETGDFFTILEEDGAGICSRPLPDAFVYQMPDSGPGSSVMCELPDKPNGSHIVYNVTGAYLVSLDSKLPVFRFGLVKLVQTGEVAE